MKERGLYVHIPFCVSKCAYCDFYSLPSSELHAKYIDALCKSAHLTSESFSDTLFTSVYIGGGTPSILSDELLKKLLSSIEESFNISDLAEFTLEANPATLTHEKLSVITDGGVNRLSLGCQSAVDKELEKLNRRHDFKGFRESFIMAREHGIENISADLMYGIPFQTLDSLLFSIRSVTELSPEHISLYGLRIEPETPFGRDQSLPLPSDDTQCEMYERSVEELSALGYKRYEISNFAKDGHISRHNMRYWECGEYLGLGAAAHSYIDRVRYAYPRDAKHYIEALENGKIPKPSEVTTLTNDDMQSEYIMLSMRLEKGLSLDIFKEKFGNEASEGLVSKASPYIPKFILHDGENIRFTTEGFLVSNTILSELIQS